jgi:hypothetical protein
MKINESVKKVVLSTVLAKIVNDNIVEDEFNYKVLLKLSDSKAKVFRDSIESNEFHFLEPMNVRMQNNLVIFTADKDEYKNLTDFKEQFSIDCDNMGYNLFDLKYNENNTILGLVKNKMIEGDIKNYKMDKVLESNIDFHITRSSNNQFKMDVQVRSDNRDNLSFSISEEDDMFDIVSFAQGVKDKEKELNIEVKNKTSIKRKM